MGSIVIGLGTSSVLVFFSCMNILSATKIEDNLKDWYSEAKCITSSGDLQTSIENVLIELYKLQGTCKYLQRNIERLNRRVKFIPNAITEKLFSGKVNMPVFSNTFQTFSTIPDLKLSPYDEGNATQGRSSKVENQSSIIHPDDQNKLNQMGLLRNRTVVSTDKQLEDGTFTMSHSTKEFMIGIDKNEPSVDQRRNSLPKEYSDSKSSNKENPISNVINGGKFPEDCSDATVQHPGATSGIYLISPANEGMPFRVFCQMEGGESSLVFQRRLNGQVDFYRTWEDYKQGFGDLSGEFWLGNEKLHLLTKARKYKLRIDMWDWDTRFPLSLGNHYFAESADVFIGDEESAYFLHVPAGFYAYSGHSGSGLRVHSGPFMTFDKGPSGTRENCADLFHCGWWFSTCVRNANLNGRYYQMGYENVESKTRAVDDVFWLNIPRSLKKVEMKLLRINT
ncbi:hypothetical protein CHS0354_036629 [Potamilus streckersoni]|uniref:Fibrinogen C-terminal domain-containing protein n=1 Tax=Potamilus streckersoni TaxID=2493646 RepID=A0AAE0W0C6_9BIVA|nr:hypothetical protein CHS0354_036629 [Potamilus streckersoni]